MVDVDHVLQVLVLGVLEQNCLCLSLFIHVDVLMHGNDGAKLATRNLDVKLTLKPRKMI